MKYTALHGRTPTIVILSSDLRMFWLIVFTVSWWSRFYDQIIYQNKVFLYKNIFIPGWPGRTSALAARTRSRPPRPGSARPRRTGGRAGGTSPGRPGTESPLGRSRAWRPRGDSWWSCLRGEAQKSRRQCHDSKRIYEEPPTVSRKKAKFGHPHEKKRQRWFILLLICGRWNPVLPPFESLTAQSLSSSPPEQSETLLQTWFFWVCKLNKGSFLRLRENNTYHLVWTNLRPVGAVQSRGRRAAGTWFEIYFVKK